MTKTITTTCCISGGGPAGLMLGPVFGLGVRPEHIGPDLTRLMSERSVWRRTRFLAAARGPA
jgi:hypothetical protein